MKRRRILISLCIAFALVPLIALAWAGARRLTRGALLVSAHTGAPGKERTPAEGAALYLLDEDMMKLALAKEGGLNPLQEKVFRENPKLRSLAGLMSARRREAYSLGPEVADFMEQSRGLWEPHVIRAVKTDAEGRATFEGLMPGDYWLMASASANGGVAFWNLSVQVGRGQTSITLEPSNSLQCSGCR